MTLLRKMTCNLRHPVGLRHPVRVTSIQGQGLIHTFDLVACLCVTWLIYICDWPHSYVWHGWFMCMTWLTMSHVILSHMYDMIHMYDMTYYESAMSHIWHTHDLVWHDLLINVTQSHSRWHMRRNLFMHVYNSPHSYVRHDWIICMTWLIHVVSWPAVSFILPTITKSYLWIPSRWHFMYSWLWISRATQVNLIKRKLGEPWVYLKPVEQTLYGATVRINNSATVPI